MRPIFVSCALCAVISPSAQAQNGAYATKVVAYDTNNQAGGGIFKPTNALGAPVASSTAVHSLGVGGFLTLGFAVTITDGPGADLLVFENPFAIANGQIFAEAVFVEVSSNGTDFARFPTRYQGPATSGGSFATGWAGWYAGFGGIKPSNGGQPGVDNFDVVQAGGDAFDLADLRNHRLVLNNKVDLRKITQVRLVDVVAGTSKDSAGRTIQDPTAGSADINAVAALHHTGNAKGVGPRISLDLPPSGNLTLGISDPGGLTDLDPNSLRVALDGVEFPPIILIQMMTVTKISATSVTLNLGGNLPAGWLLHLSVSVRDKAGYRSGQTRVR